jgi:uncharacterized protein YraI
MPSFRKLISAAVTLVAIGVLPAVASAQEDFVVAYTANDLNLRDGPGTEFRVLTTMPQGAEVRVLYCASDQTWCYLQFQNHVGWASSRYLTSSPPQYAHAPQQPQYQPSYQQPQYHPQQQYQQYPQQQYAQQQYAPYPQQYVPYQQPHPTTVLPTRQLPVVVVQPAYPTYWARPQPRLNFWLNLMFH